MKTTLGYSLALGALTAVVGYSAPAGAQQYGERHDYYWDRDTYSVEVEPHFAFGAEDVYGATGVGGGLRLGIPFAYGHLGRVPQNLAFDFGGDVLHYDNCYYGTYCGANYVMLPAALQWNVFVARPVSLFLEGGAFFYKGWLTPCQANDSSCSAPSDVGVLPTFAFGARVHLSPDVALTARLGYPSSTLGLSFM
jgi:hypothetical protein